MLNIRTVFKNREVILLLFIILLFFVVGTVNSEFVQGENILFLITDGSILISVGLAQMLVILLRCIDLSVAAIIALSGFIAAQLNALYGLPPVYCIIIAAFAGGLCGSINGFIISLFKVPSIVVTLATMSIFRGIIFLISEGEWVKSHQMTDSFKNFVHLEFLGLNTLIWLSISMISIFSFILYKLQFGMRIYAIGNNPKATVFFGISEAKYIFIVYTIAGICSGICGYFWVARYAVAYTQIAVGFELQVIASCIIGGICILGGKGNLIGCVLGAILLAVVYNSLPTLGISPFFQMFLSGFIILIASFINKKKIII